MWWMGLDGIRWDGMHKMGSKIALDCGGLGTELGETG